MMTEGLGMTETVGRVRLVASIDSDAMRALDALAAARYGGNRSRAIDDCIAVAVSVLNRPEAFGLDAVAALAAYCAEKQVAEQG
jgi:hypothetical protein